MSEEAGEHVADFKIVASKEYFKLTDGEHKQLMGLYLDAQPWGNITKTGNHLENLQVAPFEIHIQGDNLSKLNIADIRATALRYLYVDNASKGFSISTDNHFVEFNYHNFGLNEDPSKKLRILDVAIAESKTGLRYTTQNGNYIVIGAVAGFGVSGDVQAIRDEYKIYSDTFDPQLRVNGGGNLFNDSPGLEGLIGAFGEINFNDTFKLYGSGQYGTVASKSHWEYSANTLVNGKDVTAYRYLDINTQRSKMEARLHTDLGKLISPFFTGVAIDAGFDFNHYDVVFSQTEHATKTDGVKTEYPALVNMRPTTTLRNFNQVQFNVGISISPSAIYKRQKKMSKYRGMVDLYGEN
jgi:hypothetical protein